MSKQLLISLDPGFDSMKVIANGNNFKFPFVARETDERKLSDYGDRQDFILYKDEAGATWRVGQFARSILFGEKGNPSDDPMQSFYTEERFISAEFIVGLRSAIARAIDMAGLYEQQADLDIRLIVALPHAVRTKYASTVVGLAAGEHSYYMTLNKEAERMFHFTIDERNIYTISQTIAAILGETSNEKGYINQERYFYLSNGPTLVIDGGYYTTGIVPVSRGGSVDDTHAESDVRHAMKNVNIAIAQELAEKRPDIKHYNVEYLLSQGETLLRSMNRETGMVESIDLGVIREAKLRAVCADFLAYLDSKYDNLLDFRYILVAGGTGASFFNQMFEHYRNTGLMDDKHMLLTVPTLNDADLPIEFAIAVGAYKGLRGKIE